MEYQPQNMQLYYYGNDQVETESTRVNNRTIFVGGLNLETTETDLSDYFTKFGSIESVDVKVDHNTGISKGFAFIIFNAAESVGQVTAAGEHVINNKKVDAQAAQERNSKIFVGGISNEITDEDVKSHFSQFGNIVRVEMPYDKTTNLHKHFCFVIFDSEQVARKVLQHPHQIIKNKHVTIQRVSKTNQRDNQRFSAQSNFGAFGQNWGQTYGNQTYYGGYGFNNQQGYPSVFGGFYNDYGTSSYAGYIGTDSHTASPGYYSAPIGRGVNRGVFSEGRGGPSRGRGNRFLPF